MKNKLIVALAACACLTTACLDAATIGTTIGIFQTLPGAQESGGNSVSAYINFQGDVDFQGHAAAGIVSINLFNLQQNAVSIDQAISDISFRVTGGNLSSASLVLSQGNEETINSDGSFSVGGLVRTGWVLSNPSAGILRLDAPAGPSHLVAPSPSPASSVYPPSFTENPGLNPFIANAFFNIHIPGVTSIDDVVLSFGTTAGNNVLVPNVPDGGTTVILLSSALSGLALMRRKLSQYHYLGFVMPQPPLSIGDGLMWSAQCSRSIGFHLYASSSESNSGSPIGVTSHSPRNPSGCPVSSLTTVPR